MEIEFESRQSRCKVYALNLYFLTFQTICNSIRTPPNFPHLYWTIFHIFIYFMGKTAKNIYTYQFLKNCSLD